MQFPYYLSQLTLTFPQSLQSDMVELLSWEGQLNGGRVHLETQELYVLSRGGY